MPINPIIPNFHSQLLNRKNTHANNFDVFQWEIDSDVVDIQLQNIFNAKIYID